LLFLGLLFVSSGGCGTVTSKWCLDVEATLSPAMGRWVKQIVLEGKYSCAFHNFCTKGTGREVVRQQVARLLSEALLFGLCKDKELVLRALCDLPALLCEVPTQWRIRYVKTSLCVWVKRVKPPFLYWSMMTMTNSRASWCVSACAQGAHQFDQSNVQGLVADLLLLAASMLIEDSYKYAKHLACTAPPDSILGSTALLALAMWGDAETIKRTFAVHKLLIVENFPSHYPLLSLSALLSLASKQEPTSGKVPSLADTLAFTLCGKPLKAFALLQSMKAQSEPPEPERQRLEQLVRHILSQRCEYKRSQDAAMAAITILRWKGRLPKSVLIHANTGLWAGYLITWAANCFYGKQYDPLTVVTKLSYAAQPVDKLPTPRKPRRRRRTLTP